MTQAADGHIPVVILTGLSGAGKSTALKVFEDLGFLSVDGMPPGLIPAVVRLFDTQAELHHRGLTLGIDVRQSDFLAQWDETLAQCATLGIRPRIVFVECSRAVLLRRYAATRRPHPLEGALSLDAAVDRERAMLAPVREQAELVLDTTGYSIHDLRRTLQEKWNFLRDKRWGLRLYILSFGFKHGVPTDADLVFDLRFLPNPHFEEALQPLSGKDEPVARFVLGREPGDEFLRRQIDYLNFLLPLYAREGRYRLTIAFGCTGGRHRSVAVAEAVFDSLRNSDYAVFLEHRHIDLK
ncbi:RNase adapter RapZ [Desulfocurvus vexinensis]|uniref:RNase adapter RapZ n=1 Tax=Desulfocurvus vexinensis TaxID=399548 RepID=UPI00048ADB14|nr:RNase adapter RapZ [Desulfocurvus vexinensis]